MKKKNRNDNSNDFSALNSTNMRLEGKLNTMYENTSAVKATNDNLNQTFFHNPDKEINIKKNEDEFNNKGIVFNSEKDKSKRISSSTIDLSVTTMDPLKSSIKKIDFVISIFILINISLSIAGGSIYSDEILGNNNIVLMNRYETNQTTTIIKYFNIGVIVILELLLIKRYLLKVQFLRKINLASINEGLFQIGLWKYLLLEMFILGIFCPPDLNTVNQVTMLGGKYYYSYYNIFNFFVLFKLYYFLRLIRSLSKFTNENVKRLAKKYKITIGTSFVLKAHLKKYPYFTLSFIMVFTVLVLGFIIRNFEIGYLPDVNIGNQTNKSLKTNNFNLYSDSFWVIITSMLTLGYGDIFPCSHFGRCVAIIAAIIGMLLISILILNLSSLIEFTPEEKKAYSMINKMLMTKTLNETAKSLIIQLLKLNQLKQSKAKNRLPLFMNHVLIIRYVAQKFNKEMKICKSRLLPSDEILIELQKKLESDVKLMKCQERTIANVKKLTRCVIEEERKILRGMEYLKSTQNEIADFLLKCNQEVSNQD